MRGCFGARAAPPRARATDAETESDLETETRTATERKLAHLGCHVHAAARIDPTVARHRGQRGGKRGVGKRGRERAMFLRHPVLLPLLPCARSASVSLSYVRRHAGRGLTAPTCCRKHRQSPAGADTLSASVSVGFVSFFFSLSLTLSLSVIQQQGGGPVASSAQPSYGTQQPALSQQGQSFAGAPCLPPSLPLSLSLSLSL
eukprot:COSAG03_NODE_9154_length_742_cov_1.040435_1_plen_201_part_10